MAIAGTAALALGAGALASLGPVASNASSHREAPLTSADPQIDSTDLYAFASPDKPNTVTLVSSWYPLEEPAGGPNFYTWAEHTNYDIKIDNNGDARADIIYRWTFKTHYVNPDSFIFNNGPVTSLKDPNLLVRQTYDLYRLSNGRSHQLLNNAPVAPSRVGDASMPAYNTDLFDAAIKDAGGGAQSWVGQSDDPFFLDLRVFDLLYGADFSETGDDTLTGFNVNTMAIQVPDKRLRGPRDSVIGVWTTASRPGISVQKSDGSKKLSGRYVQVSRLGMPLVNEVVVPIGAKDYFNGSRPVNDAQFLPAVQDPELARLVNAVYPTIDVPDSNMSKAGIQRADLIQVFLTGIPGVNQPKKVRPSEMLRLNIDTPPCTGGGCDRLGVIGGDMAGFPNGRRLSDDILDVSLRVMMGVLIPGHDMDADTLGDGVDVNDAMFLPDFPYVAYPTAGSVANPH